MKEKGEQQFRDSTPQQFADLVESVGIRRFAKGMHLSTRQINRMRSGTQPNPVERIIRCLQSATPEVGDRVLDFICQEMGGHFVRHEPVDSSIINAVRECAEAIAAISDGEICEDDIREVREAISALSSILRNGRHDSEPSRRMDHLSHQTR